MNCHGNFMVIHELGVLFTGDANIGKSELSLSLLARGHQLVSDDVVDIVKKNNQLLGCAPNISKAFILINHFGIMNVKKLFGEHAWVNQHSIDLIIHLVSLEKTPLSFNPLEPYSEKITLFDTSLLQITLPLLPEQNFPLLIETLIRNYLLKLSGYNAAHDFEQRQYAAIKKDPACNKKK